MYSNDNARNAVYNQMQELGNGYFERELHMVVRVLAGEEKDEVVNIEYSGPDFGLAILVARSILARYPTRDENGLRLVDMPTVRLFTCAPDGSIVGRNLMMVYDRDRYNEMQESIAGI